MVTSNLLGLCLCLSERFAAKRAEHLQLRKHNNSFKIQNIGFRREKHIFAKQK